MAKTPFVAAAVFNPRPPCGGRWVVHLHAFFDCFIDSINSSAAATSTANKMLTIARFIVGSSFPHTRFLSLHDFPTNPSNIRGERRKDKEESGKNGQFDSSVQVLI